MTSSSFFPSCSSFPQRTYDVFLSFRGEDTRKSFTDHLYSALDSQGIYTFRDDEELERGQPISSKLLEAIQESSIALAVLSINYASSTWCLEELAAIVECMEKMGKTVFPIFYNVDPSDVRKQTGKFGEAFDTHEKRFEDRHWKEKVKKWRSALIQVSNLSGFHLQERYETEFIQEIISVLNRTLPLHSNDLKLTGIEFPIKEIMKLCSATSKGNDVVFIGIWGMGGIGKTALAQAFYDKVSAQFIDKCFLKNVREISRRDGIVALTKDLLSIMFKRMDVHYSEIRRRLRHKKVLIVIDDVDNLEQLEALAGSTDWFGHGSRIIITTRDEQLLIAHRVDRRYKVKKLNDEHAFELFSWRAFRNNHPPKDYMELTFKFVNYVKGHPLAIKVLGALLCDRSPEEWESAFSRMKENLDQNVMSHLRIGFDGLHKKEQEIFLDIACFFKGRDRDEVTLILEGFGFHPIFGIEALIRKSLITIVDNKLWMHDLLQEMGWELVREECLNEPGNWSRLWQSADVLGVMKYNKGSDAVQGIVLDLPQGQKEQLRCDALSNMKKLRFLKFSNVLLPQGLNYLSTELQVLEWHGYPVNLLPKSFPSEKLVQLDMCGSHIKYLWKGCRHLDKLKSIDLECSESLIETPDFTGVPNLEMLILEGCINLSKVHPSISSLKRLVLLNMKNCKSLEFLPGFISLESLEIFYLSNCVGLKRFPEILGDMEFLFKLYLGGTAVEELPESIGRLTGLTLLDLADCKNLEKLPDVFSSLSKLETINLAGCSNLIEIPENFRNAVCLEKLDISGTATGQMPSSIVTSLLLPHIPTVRPGLGLLLAPSSFFGFCFLRELNLRYCNLLDAAIPNYFEHFSSLEVLRLGGNPFTRLPESINRMSKLERLEVEYCSQLQSLPKFPSNLEYVWAKGCVSLQNDSDQYDLFESGEKRHVYILKHTATGICCVNILISQFATWLKRYHEVRISQPMSTASGLSPNFLEIPNWFNNSSSSNSIRVPITGDDKRTWMGYALLVLLEIDEDFDPTSGFKVKNQFDTMEDLHYNGSLYHEINVKDVPRSIVSHGYWIIMPRQWFSTKLNKSLNECSSIESHTSISDCPHVVVKCSGARLLYNQHDFEDFVQAITYISFRSTSLKKSSSNLSLMVAEDGTCKLDSTIPLTEHLRCLPSDLKCWEKQQIRGGGMTYKISGYITDSQTAYVFGEILQEYSGQCHIKYGTSFPQCEIPEWFCSATGIWDTIPLNPSLEWKGIAICASFTVQGNCSLVLDNLDLNSPQIQFLCAALDRYFSVYDYIDRVLINTKCCGFICILYLSRLLISSILEPESSSLLELQFEVNSLVEDIRVERFGFQVVCQENMDELMETIVQCSTSPQFQSP